MSGEGTTNLPSTTDVVGRMENNLVPSHTIDLISKLPLHILHHILGFLLAKDAAGVAVLSKTWYQVWDTLPFLDFGGKLSRTDMLPYVDSILSHRKNQGLGVHKFRFGSGKHLQSYLDSWIRILKDLQIHDLSLRYRKSMNQCAELPENLSSLISMVSLELNGFHLDSFRGVDIINWPSLRKLHLSRMLLNDDVIHNIVTNCYAIEDLRFEVCYGLNVITISSLVKLQSFEMICATEYPKVEINIPSLRSFRYVDAKMEDCFRIKACTMLKKLSFAGDFITQEWFDKLFSLFPLLESLTIGSCNRVVKMNISSCNLRYISLQEYANLVEANIDTPNLSTFSYTGVGSLPLTLNASPQLHVRICVLVQKYDLKTPGKCSKVITLLRKMSHFGAVRLYCYLESLYFLKEIKDELIYSKCDLKDFKLRFCLPFDYTFTIDDATRLLDNVFWIYPQLENFSILAREDELPALEVLHEMLSCGEEGLGCCDSIPMKCWRHFLKEVKLEKLEDNADHFEKVLKINLRPRE